MKRRQEFSFQRFLINNVKFSFAIFIELTLRYCYFIKNIYSSHLEKEKEYYAKILFKNKIFTFEGQKFQDFFIKLMHQHNSDFQPVKPQGRIGDKKNDGFEKTKGLYYQVYAPEEISENITREKLESDFVGLYRYWQSKCPITEFNFVINDKYKGVYPTIYSEILKLSKKYKNVKINIILAQDLEDIFMSLNEKEMESVLDFLIPEAEKIENLDYSIFNEVIEYILDNLESLIKIEKYVNPNFDQKIIFNNLDEKLETLLRMGSFQISIMNKFFKYNSKYTKQDLSNRFSNLYLEAKRLFTDENNQIFFYIFEFITPKTQVNPSQVNQIQSAILVLMSYFFELCDIFEPPNS